MAADTVDDVVLHHEGPEEQEGERRRDEGEFGNPPSSPFFTFFVVTQGR